MPDYSLGKIYKLVIDDKFYIGSTCQKYLSQRLALHFNNMKTAPGQKVYIYMASVEKQKISIELLEAFPCANKSELNARENYHIEMYKKNTKCLNIRGSITTEESKKDTRDKNNARKAELITCECGAEIARGYLHQHIKMKCHFEALGIPYVKQAIRSEEAINKQKEKASAREKQDVICECGAKVKYGSLYLHKKSKAHQNALTTPLPSL